MTILPAPKAALFHPVRSPPTVSRVIIVSDFCDLQGGQAKVAIDSARLLAEAGYDVIFFGASGVPDPRLDHPKIRVVGLGQVPLANGGLRVALAGLWNGTAATELRDLITTEAGQGTVVHVHGFAKALSPAIGPVLATAPVPVIYTLHEYFLACPNGGLFDYQERRICTRMPMSAACIMAHCDARQRSHKAYRLLRQIILHRVGKLPQSLCHIVVLTERQRQIMAGHLPKNAQLHLLANPVTSPPKSPNTRSRSGPFAFVGRLSPEKGAPLFARAAALAKVPAMFIGDGADAAAVRSANPDAEITGWLAHSDVQERLSQARALVLPSLWYECQPLVMLEALSMGVPVVAGRWISGTDCITDGVNGVLFDNPEPEPLAAALQVAQTIPDFDPAPFRARFAPTAHLSGLLDIYQNALHKYLHEKAY